MAIETQSWTRADLERFPDDGNRYEVLDGELLVTPEAAHLHQVVALRLGAALLGYCDANRIGAVTSPGAVIFGDNELQPDAEVIPGTHFPRKKKWQDFPFPILVVEILSPAGRARGYDLNRKRRAYLRLDIAEYWVVDTEKRLVHVWSKVHGDEDEDDIIVSDVLRWQPQADVPPLEINLPQLFRETI